jgi:CheY-like chemotaxis protein
MGTGGYFSIDSLRGVYAVVIDADRIGRSALEAILRHCGALVTGVASESEALAVMRRIKPDAIVVATGDDGAATERFIRAVRALKPEDGGTVPLIIVNERGAAGESVRTSAGDTWLRPPLDPWELCRVLAHHTMA